MSNKFVIAGGFSLAGFDTRGLMIHGHVYGVNDSALWTNVHTAVTMDRLWFEYRWPYLRARRVADTYVRAKCDCNVRRVDKRDNWKTFDHRDEATLSREPNILHGGNSATVAVNLAFQSMKQDDNLFLLGFDMQRGPNDEPYWYPPYPWVTHNRKTGQPTGQDMATKPGHFRAWAHDFQSLASEFRAAKMNVYNVNHRSLITVFPKISFEKMMEIVQ